MACRKAHLMGLQFTRSASGVSRWAVAPRLQDFGGSWQRAVVLRQRRFASNVGTPDLPGQVAPQPGDADTPQEPKSGKRKERNPNEQSTLLKMFESSMTTFASLFVLGYGVPPRSFELRTETMP